MSLYSAPHSRVIKNGEYEQDVYLASAANYLKKKSYCAEQCFYRGLQH